MKKILLLTLLCLFSLPALATVPLNVTGSYVENYDWGTGAHQYIIQIGPDNAELDGHVSPRTHTITLGTLNAPITFPTTDAAITYFYNLDKAGLVADGNDAQGSSFYAAGALVKISRNMDDLLNAMQSQITGLGAPFSGAYGDLTGTPTALSSFSNDTNFITSSALSGYLTSTTGATTYVPLNRTINGVDLSANRTFTQDAFADGTTNKAYTSAEKTKLAGIATAATANSSDSTLLNRANHTGTEFAAVISDFTSAARATVSVSGNGSYNSTTGVVTINNNAPTASALGANGTNCGTGQYSQGIDTAGNAEGCAVPTTGTHTFNYPTRTLTTCFQISSSQDADFDYSVDITAGLVSLGGGTGLVTSYTNSGCTTGAQPIINGGVSSVALGGTSSILLHGVAPKGVWLKITGTGTGLATASVDAIANETLLP